MPWIYVQIEFKRIQTFIFSVPRLRVMLGANRLIGQVIHKELPDISDKLNPVQIDAQIPPPGSIGACEDPLGGALADDPVALYRRGILARDGGRYRVVFADAEDARRFVEQAREVIDRLLPGMRYEIDVVPQDTGRVTSVMGVQPPQLPYFEVCQDSGTGVASTQLQISGALPGETPRLISTAVDALRQAGGKREEMQAMDLLSVIQQDLPLHECRQPVEIEQLAGSAGYVALIHADGNGVGHRVGNFKEHCRQQFHLAPDAVLSPAERIQLEASVESFFWSMRHAMRCALKAAMEKVYGADCPDNYAYRPYQLLMFGGDDLLILCRPEQSLQLVAALGTHLKKFLLADDKPLSLGVGVCIAKQSVPFHLMTDLADALAASAKKRYRQTGEETTVVDWNTATTSWIDQVFERRRHQFNGINYLRTGRPYVVQDAATGEPSLSDILDLKNRVESLLDSRREGGISRAKLKELARRLYEKPGSAAAHYQRFFSGERAGVNRQFHKLLKGYPWFGEEKDEEGTPWVTPYSERLQLHVTYVLDVIEMLEGSRLGSIEPPQSLEAERQAGAQT